MRHAPRAGSARGGYDDRDADPDRGQESFWLLTQILYGSSGAASAHNQVAEAGFSKRYDGDLRPGEDAVYQDQGKNDEDFRNGGNSPLHPRRLVTGRRRQESPGGRVEVLRLCGCCRSLWRVRYAGVSLRRGRHRLIEDRGQRSNRHEGRMQLKPVPHIGPQSLAL